MMPISYCETGTLANFRRGALPLFLSSLLIFFLCIAALFAQPAVAATRYYSNGNFYSTPSQIYCTWTGLTDTVLQSYTGYYTDGSTFPKTGDVTYVHAVGSNVSGCFNNDAFGPEFFLPDGASFAVSATNPVYCWLGKLDNSITPYQVPNTANGSCSQAYSIGSHGGAFFGWSALAPGWWLEVQVPYVFSKTLLGLAGTPGSILNVAASSAYPPYNVYPNQAVTVFPGPQTLTVSKAGTGAGTVTSSPVGINCGATCSASFTLGSSVTLTASPTAGSTFSGWSGGGCSGTGTCTATMSSAQNVTATFVASGPLTLTVSKAGTGAGTVTSSPAGINCGATCSAGFTSGSGVTLTAGATAGSTFSGWSGGGCSGTGTCTVTMSSAQGVTATFASSGPQTLTVSKAGTGVGTVTSSPAGINCGATCSASFTLGSGVTLSAAATAGSMFTGWSGGGCSGTGTCTVTMSSAQSVTANLMRQMGSLSVTLGGLPASSTATLGITGPDAFSTTHAMMVGTGFNLSDVPTGTYTVTPPNVIISGRTYTAPPQSAVVNFGTTATINVVYRPKVADLTPILMLLLN